MSKPIKVFISYRPTDRGPAARIHQALSEEEDITPWMADIDILPGESIAAISQALNDSDVFLLCLSGTDENFIFSTEHMELGKAQQMGKLVIPVLLDIYAQLPGELKQIQPVRLYDEDGFDQLLRALRAFKRRPAKPPIPRNVRNLFITRVQLSQISCFASLDLDLTAAGVPAPWTMLVGDNAAGKSTLLRSIALGLCSESDAVALMKELPGDLIRKGATEGEIVLGLQDPSDKEQYTITTSIKKASGGEIVRKSIEPEQDLSWSDLFVCGYGTQRNRQAHASFDRYSARNAVETLFADDASLQNPEVVLLRQPAHLRAEIESRLLEVLMLGRDFAITYADTGPEISGPWGEQHLTSLSDGYRSTAQWVLDLFSWLVLAGRPVDSTAAGGILLIDEVEQHLHPRWQRYIARRLGHHLPSTQIIASTHTPLVAAGAADLQGSLIVRLRIDDDGTVSHHVIDKASLVGRRADQVLASDAFGLVTTRSPASETLLHRYTTLLGQRSRTSEEEEELGELAAQLRAALQTGENDLERAVEEAVGKALKESALALNPELLELETKRQLQEVFGGVPSKEQQ